MRIAMWLIITALMASANERSRAEACAHEAFAHYEAGRLVEAAEKFEEAYVLSKEPTQLRNAAKTLELAGELERARDRWGEYASLALRAADRAEAEEHLAALREKLEAPPPEPAAPVVIEAPPAVVIEASPVAVTEAPAPVIVQTPIVATGDSPTPIAGYLTLAGGIALAATSAILWTAAADRAGDLDARLAERNASGEIIGISRAGANQELSSINNTRTMSAALACAAAAAIGLGATLTWLEW